MNNAFDTDAPLTQVELVHDYLQLAFGDALLSVYNTPQLHIREKVLHLGDPGFDDSLASLIGRHVLHARTDQSGSLVVTFDDSSRFVVSADASAVFGPEAWQWAARDKPPVVRQNV